ncbi:DUF1707 domain-containing protein [Streptomyces sp. STR69]|uniref:DUF1707 SHOCT-like domain-containing protein n=1 Tax=Streptomyces sp. STR69 TaxID=1796942 RepID=UPI0021C7C352|nr:DUF1707 domain-containing protein [Streptomyces sp. STR69]
MRVSHADRDRMVEILRDAAADGRLDIDELGERAERALTARIFADLEPLAEDLPVAAPAPPTVRGPAATAPADGELERRHVNGERLHREGAWMVPRVIKLDVHGGSARLPEGEQSTLRVSTHGTPGSAACVHEDASPNAVSHQNRVTKTPPASRPHRPTGPADHPQPAPEPWQAPARRILP